MKTHYPADKQLIDGMSKEDQFVFGTWIAQLEHIVRDYGQKHLNGDVPYGIPLRESTGLLCWHEMFAEGTTPREAFEADRECWDTDQ